MNKDIIRKIMILDGFKEYKRKISLNKKSGLVKKLKDIDKDKNLVGPFYFLNFLIIS